MRLWRIMFTALLHEISFVQKKEKKWFALNLVLRVISSSLPFFPLYNIPVFS